MDPLRHVKPAVRAISAYTLAAREARVKINQNENPFDLPEAVKRRVLERALARPWSRYPEFDPKELLAALARSSGWRADGVLAGNGSNELIAGAAAGDGRRRHAGRDPRADVHALRAADDGPGRRAGARRAAREADGRFSLRRRAAARSSPREPRRRSRSSARPTTRPASLPLARDRRLCDDADGLVVIDEAYHEFAGSAVVPLLERHPNLIVLRTFSKAMALAGLRVGYLLASPELVREINKARLPVQPERALADRGDRRARRARAAGRRRAHAGQRARAAARALQRRPRREGLSVRRQLHPARAAGRRARRPVFEALYGAACWCAT